MNLKNIIFSLISVKEANEFVIKAVIYKFLRLSDKALFFSNRIVSNYKTSNFYFYSVELKN